MKNSKKSCPTRNGLIYSKVANQLNSRLNYTEFQIIAEYFLHNANVERIFSLSMSQWPDERNRLLIESIKSAAMVKYNFKGLSCLDFFDMILKNEKV